MLRAKGLVEERAAPATGAARTFSAHTVRAAVAGAVARRAVEHVRDVRSLLLLKLLFLERQGGDAQALLDLS